MNKAIRETKSTSAGSNVYPFQAISEDFRILRQQAIREHLMSLACMDGEQSAIASACALLQKDGTLLITAKGIDADVALRMADGLDRLSAAVRSHAIKPTQSSRQRGIGTTTLAIAIGFMAATFINEVPWIDAALILAAQLIAARIASRPPLPRPSPNA